MCCGCHTDHPRRHKPSPGKKKKQTWWQNTESTAIKMTQSSPELAHCGFNSNILLPMWEDFHRGLGTHCCHYTSFCEKIGVSFEPIWWFYCLFRPTNRKLYQAKRKRRKKKKQKQKQTQNGRWWLCVFLFRIRVLFLVVIKQNANTQMSLTYRTKCSSIFISIPNNPKAIHDKSQVKRKQTHTHTEIWNRSNRSQNASAKRRKIQEIKALPF